MREPQAFGIWITGLPASGKSTITAALVPRLEALGLPVEILESDALRRSLTPSPTYSHEERDFLYRAMAFLGSRLVAHGVTVIFDATANHRSYRDLARTLIPRFLEVAVECPLEVCIKRDRKGTYQAGFAGKSATVPGLQDVYEPPLQPDVLIESATIKPEAAVEQIWGVLRARGYLDEQNQ